MRTLKTLPTNNYTVTKEPFMFQNDKWWFVVQNDENYVFDVDVSTDELFKLCVENDFNEFLTNAKAGKLNLINKKLKI